MEYAFPRTTVSCETGITTYSGPIARTGALFVALPRDGAGGWTLTGQLFSGRDGFPYVVGPNQFANWTIGPDGTVETDPVVAVPWNPQTEQEADNSTGGFFAPALAISFLHCKNVTVEDAKPVGSRQQRRLEQRRGVRHSSFKTLVIEPMRQVLRTEGQSERHGLQRALHICRGHFAHYSEDRPLFGKYSGTFWRPAHVRGSAEIGMVGKDYKVTAPKAVAS
jgi:hypothetical protein